jgi:hypothetical protein
MANVGTMWARITEFPEYAVSSDGRVMRLTPAKRTSPGFILRPQISERGYLTVRLRGTSPKFTSTAIHRLVAKSFIPNPENKPEVNHVNGSKTTNTVDNLDWVTSAENSQHAFTLGLRLRGERCKFSKLTRVHVVEIRALRASGLSHRKIAAMFKVSDGTIGKICRKESWL